MILKLAWRNLWRNKRRTLITTGAVFFAVLLSALMNSLQIGVYDKMIENVVGLYTGYVQVHQKGYWDDQTLDNTFEAPPSMQALIKEHPEVSEVVPRLESFTLAAAGQQSTAGQVVGTDPAAEDRMTQLGERVVEGHYFSADDQAVMIGDKMAEKLNLGVGDSIILLGQGYHGVTAVGQYPIAAILHFGSPEQNKRMIYMPLALAQAHYASTERLTSYALQLDRGRLSGEVAADLRQELDTANYEVMDWKEMMPEMIQLMQADVGGNYVMLGILYMVIGFGIFGTVLMMTQERSYEFGVMIAVGMKRLRLSFMVMLEMIFMTLLGVLAGLGVAVPIAMYFHANPIDLGTGDMGEVYAEYGFEPIMPASLDPSIFINQAVTVLILTLVVTLYPAWKISRLMPIEAMRA